METALHVLADAPALKPGAPTTSRMIVAKTGRFRDRRYGTFEITRKDFDDWRASLSLHPEGKVMVDLDHASEKGKSTEAAGWITGLDQRGADSSAETPDQLWATVEWTSLGVEAIRDRRYRFVSPSYGPYEDEEGRKHSNVLTSVALTNRPFLRKGMPAVTLSQNVDADTLTSVAARKETDVSTQTDEAFENAYTAAEAACGGTPPCYDSRDGARVCYEAAPEATLNLLSTYARLGLTPGEQSLMLARDGSPRPGGGAAGTGHPPLEPPSDLGTAAKALWRKAEERSRSTSIPFLIALSEITGFPPKGDVPPPDITGLLEPGGTARADLSEGTNSRVEQHHQAIRLMLELEVGYMDALAITELDAELTKAEADDGSSETPWLDTSRDERPIPWSTADWERDQRRANTIGLGLDREGWRANAEAGVDIVYVTAEKLRQERRADLRAMKAQKIDGARVAERMNRRVIVEDNLARMTADQAIDMVTT